jgi:muramoyltetrapeptide carboxypeptidase
MIPKKLMKGDHIRVIAPADSISPDLDEDIIRRGVDRLGTMGFEVSFGKHVREVDVFKSTSIENRLQDLHEAFSDPSVDGILALTGGSTSNQLLKHIDYDLIRKNPKFICGLSDITALVNAIYTKTGLVTFYGPHFMSIAASSEPEYTLNYLAKCMMEDDREIKAVAASYFYNTQWAEERQENSGHWIINEGEAEGTIIGGNFLTFNFIQGTEYIVYDKQMIYVLEDNGAESVNNVQNQLQALMLQAHFKNVRGLVIGRFREESGMSRELLTKLVKSKRELDTLPVIANVDFGHTVPQMTLPIGGYMHVRALNQLAEIRFRKQDLSAVRTV